MTPTSRIINTSRAVAELLGTNCHMRYIDIVTLVIYADEAVNKLDDWDLIANAEWKAMVERAAEELHAMVAHRASRRKEVLRG